MTGANPELIHLLRQITSGGTTINPGGVQLDDGEKLEFGNQQDFSIYFDGNFLRVEDENGNLLQRVDPNTGDIVFEAIGGDPTFATHDHSESGMAQVPNAGLVNDSVTVTAGDGLKSGGSVALGSSVTLDIEPADFAGQGLEDDGADNLRVASTAAGDGLKGGSGSALAIEPADFAGAGLSDDGADNLQVNAGTGLAIDADDVVIAVDGVGIREIDQGIEPSWVGFHEFNAGLVVTDDNRINFGDANNYWAVYDSNTSAFLFRSTDVDGGGSDGTIYRIQDGQQDVEFISDISFPNVTGTPSFTSHDHSEGGMTAVPNTGLVNSSITIAAGDGLQNGGTVALGGSVTLDANVSDFAGDGLGEDGSNNLQVNVGNALTITSDTVQVAQNSIQVFELDESISPTWTGTHTFDGAVTMGTNVDYQGSFLPINLPEPVDNTDAARKVYVDGVAQGLNLKESVRATTDGTNIDLTSTTDPNPIDGVTLNNGDRVLLKDQTDATENGIYIANTATDPSTWTRSPDADEDSEVTSGMFTFTEEGTNNGSTSFIVVTDDPITLGTTAIEFSVFASAGEIDAGDGLTKSGQTISIADDGVGIRELDLTIAPTWTSEHTFNAGITTSATSTSDIANTEFSADGSGNPILDFQGDGSIRRSGVDFIELFTSPKRIEVNSSEIRQFNDLTAQTGTLVWDHANDWIPLTALEANSITVTAGDGLKTGGTVTLGNSVTLDIEPADFAGTFLSDDGADNLQVNIGNGLENDGVGNIRINPADIAGNALEEDTATTLGVVADGIGTNELDETVTYTFTTVQEIQRSPGTASAEYLSLINGDNGDRWEFFLNAVDEFEMRVEDSSTSTLRDIYAVDPSQAAQMDMFATLNFPNIGGTPTFASHDHSEAGMTPIPNSGISNSSITITAGDGLKNGGTVSLGGSVTLDVEPADFAGSFLSDDGADNLAVDIGNGLENDGSGNIRVNPGAIAGNALEEDTATTIGVATDGIQTDELDQSLTYTFTNFQEIQRTPGLSSAEFLDFINGDNNDRWEFILDASDRFLMRVEDNTGPTIRDIYRVDPSQTAQMDMLATLNFPNVTGTPTFASHNHSEGGMTAIPNTGLVNDSVTITAGDGLKAGGAVALGGSVTLDIEPADFAGAGLQDDGLDNLELVNDSVTITAGDGLKDGGTVALGGSTTLNIEPADFAGAGLQDDGLDNLELVNDSITINAGDGLKNGGTVTLGGSVTIDIEPADFAGTFLSDDGADNLTVDIGNGLENDGVGNIRINPAGIAGNGLEEDTATTLGISTNGVQTDELDQTVTYTFTATQQFQQAEPTSGRNIAAAIIDSTSSDEFNLSVTSGGLFRLDVFDSSASSIRNIFEIDPGVQQLDMLSTLNFPNITGTPTFASHDHSEGGMSTIPNSGLTNNSITVTAGDGLKNGGTVALGGAVTLDIEPADFAGEFLSDDGADNLTVDIGNGLENDGSGNIRVNPGAIAGNGLVEDTVTTLGIATDGVQSDELDTSINYNWTNRQDFERPEPGSGVNTFLRLVDTTSGDELNHALTTGGLFEVDVFDSSASVVREIYQIDPAVQQLDILATLNFPNITGTPTFASHDHSEGGMSTIPNSGLTNSSITVTAGDGLKSGGTVSLGGSVTLDVEPADFAGSFLSDDGADNLQVNLGFGVEGDGVDNIRLDEDASPTWTADHTFQTSVSMTGGVGEVLSLGDDVLLRDPYYIKLGTGNALFDSSPDAASANIHSTGTNGSFPYTSFEGVVIQGRNDRGHVTIRNGDSNNNLTNFYAAVQGGNNEFFRNVDLKFNNLVGTGVTVLDVDSSTLTDSSALDAPTFTQRGYYDSDTTASISPTQQNFVIDHQVSYNGGAGASVVDFRIDGTDILTLNEPSGDVDILNGDLDLGTNDISRVVDIGTVSGARILRFNGTGRLRTGGDGTQSITVEDNNLNNIIAFQDGGDVQIFNGDLIDGPGNVIYDQSNNWVPQERLENDSLTITAGDGLKGGGSVALGNSTTVNIEPADFAGTFLSDDGADNLTVDIGFGLENDGSNNIRLDVDISPTWTGVHTFNGSVTMGTNVDYQSSFLPVNLPEPTDDQDAARKVYVDGVAQGLNLKESCRAATNNNIDLTSTTDPNPIDGVTLNDGDRVLLKDQTDATENGIYIANTATDPSTWTRSADADEDSEVTSGMFTFVEEGTNNSSTSFIVTTEDPITLGTTAINFSIFATAGQITAGDGLKRSGDTFNIEPADFAGAFLSDDGNDDLRVDIGNGLEDDGSANIRVNPGAIAGNALEEDTVTTLGVATDGIQQDELNTAVTYNWSSRQDFNQAEPGSGRSTAIRIFNTTANDEFNFSVTTGGLFRLDVFDSSATAVRDIYEIDPASQQMDMLATLNFPNITGTPTFASHDHSEGGMTTIPNTGLTNDSVTVTAGQDLSGGGTVALGSSITIGLEQVIDQVTGFAGSSTDSPSGTLDAGDGERARLLGSASDFLFNTQGGHGRIFNVWNARWDNVNSTWRSIVANEQHAGIGYANTSPGGTGANITLATAAGNANAGDAITWNTIVMDDAGNLTLNDGDLNLLSNSLSFDNLTINNSNNGNLIDSSGQLKLITDGSGSGQVVIEDAANSFQDIAIFNEGGNVEIPNGDLDISGGSLDMNEGNIDRARVQFWFDGAGNQGSRTYYNGNDSAWTIEDSTNTAVAKFNEGGNVEIPNGDLLLGNNKLREVSVIRPVLSAGNSLNLETSGGGSDGVTINDRSNANATIAQFNEGGDVDIPNGDLDVIAINSNVQENRFMDIRRDNWDAGDEFRWERSGTPGGANLRWVWHDDSAATDTNILQINNGGLVEIPNGGLSVSGSVTITGNLTLTGGNEVLTTEFIDASSAEGVTIRDDSATEVLRANDGGGVDILNGGFDLGGGAAVNFGSLEMDGDINGGGVDINVTEVNEIVGPNNGATSLQLRTQGDGTHDITLRDGFNNKNILVANEGGDVDISDGILSTDNSDNGAITLATFRSSGDQGTWSTSIVHDSARTRIGHNSTSRDLTLGAGTRNDIVIGGSGGVVTIENGNLNLSTNNITGVTQITVAEIIGNGPPVDISEGMNMVGVTRSIQDGGTDAIVFDGSANVSMPNGSLSVNGDGSFGEEVIREVAGRKEIAVNGNNKESWEGATLNTGSAPFTVSGDWGTWTYENDTDNITIQNNTEQGDYIEITGGNGIISPNLNASGQLDPYAWNSTQLFLSVTIDFFADVDETAEVKISNDGGSTWNTIGKLEQPFSDANHSIGFQQFNFNISYYIQQGANIQVWFDEIATGGGDDYRISDVRLIEREQAGKWVEDAVTDRIKWDGSVEIEDTIIRNASEASTTVGPGSSNGTNIVGDAIGHIVMDIRGNNTNDSFQVRYDSSLNSGEADTRAFSVRSDGQVYFEDGDLIDNAGNVIYSNATNQVPQSAVEDSFVLNTGDSMTGILDMESNNIEDVSNLSIGLQTPQTKLHVAQGDSGVSDADLSSENVVIESGGFTQLGVASPDADASRLEFLAPTPGRFMFIEGDYNGGSPRISVGDISSSLDVIQFNGGGSVDIPNGGLTVSGASTFSNDVSISGILSGSGAFLDIDDNLRGNSATFSIVTRGNGGDSAQFYDNANSQTILQAFEGGLVEIPNGDLSLGQSGDILPDLDGSSATTDLNQFSIFINDTSSTVADIFWDRDAANTNAFEVRDDTPTTLFNVNDNGSVEVPNGTLSVSGTPSSIGDIDFESGAFIDLQDNGGIRRFGTTYITLFGNPNRIQLSANLDVNGNPINDASQITIQDTIPDLTQNNTDPSVSRVIQRYQHSGTAKWDFILDNDTSDEIRWRDQNSNDVLRLIPGGNVEIPSGDIVDGASNVVYDQSANHVPQERVEQGSGSGLDADTVDGQEASELGGFGNDDIATDASGTVENGEVGIMHITSVPDGSSLEITQAALLLADGQAAPSNLDLIIGTMDNAGNGTSQVTVLSGDGSTVFDDSTGTPLASYTNSSGSAQTVFIGIDNGQFNTGTGSNQEMFSTVIGSVV